MAKRKYSKKSRSRSRKPKRSKKSYRKGKYSRHTPKHISMKRQRPRKSHHLQRLGRYGSSAGHSVSHWAPQMLTQKPRIVSRHPGPGPAPTNMNVTAVDNPKNGTLIVAKKRLPPNNFTRGFLADPRNRLKIEAAKWGIAKAGNVLGNRIGYPTAGDTLVEYGEYGGDVLAEMADDLLPEGTYYQTPSRPAITDGHARVQGGSHMPQSNNMLEWRSHPDNPYMQMRSVPTSGFPQIEYRPAPGA